MNLFVRSAVVPFRTPIPTATTEHNHPEGSIMPFQHMHLALIRPIFGLRHQPVPHRVGPHVFPLRIITFPSPQLHIPKRLLPHRNRPFQDRSGTSTPTNRRDAVSPPSGLCHCLQWMPQWSAILGLRQSDTVFSSVHNRHGATASTRTAQRQTLRTPRHCLKASHLLFLRDLFPMVTIITLWP